MSGVEQFSPVLENDCCEEGKNYFMEQIEALAKIDELKGYQREHAHYLLTHKDKETSEFKYTPKEVYDFITSEKD